MKDGSILELSRADKAAKKLHPQYGIPESVIESLPSPGSTLGNAQAVAEWLAQHEDVSEIEIVTNRSHMLRAWLMFVSTLYEKQFGTLLKFPEKVIDAIERILEETLPHKNSGDDRALAAVRDMLSPLLQDMRVSVKPVIVEDTLLASSDLNQRYARMIDSNPFTQEARKRNRQGISAFLRGTYQAKSL